MSLQSHWSITIKISQQYSTANSINESNLSRMWVPINKCYEPPHFLEWYSCMTPYNLIQIHSSDLIFSWNNLFLFTDDCNHYGLSQLHVLCIIQRESIFEKVVQSKACRKLLSCLQKQDSQIPFSSLAEANILQWWLAGFSLNVKW